MADPMTPERLAELYEAAKKATPGPWKFHPHTHGEKGCRCFGHNVTTGWRFNHVPDCEDTREAADNDTRDCIADAWPYEDATLAAAAPELLAEVERLRTKEAYTEELGAQIIAADARAVHDLEAEVVRLRTKLASAVGLGERMTLLWDKACGQRDAARAEADRLRPMEAALAAAKAELEASEERVVELLAELEDEKAAHAKTCSNFEEFVEAYVASPTRAALDRGA